MITLKQSVARTLPVMLIDNTDHIAPKTGVAEEDVTVVISKNGGALTAFTLTGLWTEIGQGLYTVDFAIGDLDTVGFFAYLVTSAGCDQYSGMMYVSDALPTAEENADAVWDEVVSAGAHNTLFSTGQRLFNLTLRTGTLAGDAGTDYIVFPGPWSSQDGMYEQNIVSVVQGTGAGQTRLIVEYIGADRKAYVDRAWDVVPLTGDIVELLPFSGILLATHGLAVAATANSITLAASALAIADSYVGCAIYITTGTGAGQTRTITAYTAGRVASVAPDWDTTPDATSVYKVLPVGRAIIDSLSIGAKAEIQAECTDALVVTDAKIDAAQDDLDYLKQKESGRWKITGNQLIFYENDNVTPLRTFNLFDKEGNPTDDDPYERFPV